MASPFKNDGYDSHSPPHMRKSSRCASDAAKNAAHFFAYVGGGAASQVVLASENSFLRAGTTTLFSKTNTL